MGCFTSSKEQHTVVRHCDRLWLEFCDIWNPGSVAAQLGLGLQKYTESQTHRLERRLPPQGGLVCCCRHTKLTRDGFGVAQRSLEVTLADSTHHPRLQLAVH